MSKIATCHQLLQTYPTFDSLYSLFGKDSEITALTIEPFMSAFRQPSSVAFNGELGGIGIDASTDEDCEGFFVFLNSAERHVYLFEHCCIGGTVDFTSNFALGVFDDLGLDGLPIQLIEFDTYEQLIEAFVDKVYELLELVELT